MGWKHQPKDIEIVTTHNSSYPSFLCFFVRWKRRVTQPHRKTIKVSEEKMDRGRSPPHPLPAMGKAAIMADGKVMKNTFSRWLLFFGWMIDDFSVFTQESSGLSWGKIDFHMVNCFSFLFFRERKKVPPKSRSELVGIHVTASNFVLGRWRADWLGWWKWSLITPTNIFDTNNSI